MDWSLCLICQTQSSEPCKCPLDSLHEGSGVEAYKSFLHSVAQFREHQSTPVELKLRADENVETLVTNRAVWHKQCRLKFSNSRLERVLTSRKRKREDNSDSDQKRKSRRCSVIRNDVCFFCGEEGTEDLHQVATLEVDQNVRMMATELQDTDLLARLSSGDMVAIESMYHRRCMTSLKNKYRSKLREQNNDQLTKNSNIAEARTFTELISYMESCCENGKNIFYLSELYNLYTSRLRDFNITKEINKTRLKNRILAHFCENIQEQSVGRNTVLVFNEGISSLLKKALEDLESETFNFANVSKSVRNDIFNNKGFQFSGTFPPQCQNEHIPPSLLCLVSMLLQGPNITDQTTNISQACLTIAQLILFNIKKSASPEGNKMRHSLEREPPLPVFLGLHIYHETRSKKIVDNLYHLGLSISYDGIDDLNNGMATAVCNKYKSEGVVCPTNMRSGLFTAAALDNLDHNPSSTTAQGSFHGTGISVFQFPTETNPGVQRSDITIDCNSPRDITLPENFSAVPDVPFKATDVCVPSTESTVQRDDNLVANAKAQEQCWLDHGVSMLDKDLRSDNCISWSAYHASLTQSPTPMPIISGLLPLFNEKAATVSMVKHGMDVNRQVTEYLNPGQIPVITLDQPLYTLSKYVQWKWPATHGEHVYVSMLGGLHIEMALWSLCGDLLDSSGWTTALSESGVASSGTAESFLKVSHLTRTRHAHQVTALALYKLQQDAFKSTSHLHDEESFETWRTDLMNRSPTFKFWDMILCLESLILIFIRSHRQGQFQLFVESLEALAPWFFALDHVNYARWLPVFIHDMRTLPDGVKSELTKFWVVQKSEKRFSSMPVDQAHEQNNALVKGSGGAVGLTENPIAFKRWMVAGPEMARVLKEFETSYLKKDDVNNAATYFHHEQAMSAQKTFQKQVTDLIETITQMGNPFKDDFAELVALDTRNCTDESVVKSLQTMEQIGITQYEAYVKDVIKQRTASIHDPIKRTSLALFKRQASKTITKTSKQLSAIKSDRNLFSRLYIASQHRDGDLDEFFRHENQPYPPSLSEFGQLRFTKKSELLNCLEVPTELSPPKMYNCKVFDGAALVHALPLHTATTFSEYADQVFCPFIISQLQTSTRVDVVWDTYHCDSLKKTTREKRGKGTRKKVSGQAKLPHNWGNFLLDDANKQELFSFLSEKVNDLQCPDDKSIYITSGVNVISRGSLPMEQSNHEEADTRMLVHIIDALNKGARSFFVRTVDTDVIVILAGHFFNLQSVYENAHLWVGFGTGKHYRLYSINAICEHLGEQRSNALPVFHSFTGCDTTSSFLGKGKKTAWEAWKSFPDVTAAFLYIKENPFQHLDNTSPHFITLERFTVFLYDKRNGSGSVNQARRDLFTRLNRALENIPPTQDALLQHSRRAVYQAGVWTDSNPNQRLPSPDGWGWKKADQSWLPVWTQLPEASKACSELLKCGCKKACTGRCKCVKANLSCTELCFCAAGCNNT